MTRDWDEPFVTRCSKSKMADRDEGALAQIDSPDEEKEGLEEIGASQNGEIEEDTAKAIQIAGSGGSKKKKKKKKGKKESENDLIEQSSSPTTGLTAGAAVQNMRQFHDLQRTFDLLRVNDGKPAKTKEEALRKKYQFWDTQPVPKLGESICC